MDAFGFDGGGWCGVCGLVENCQLVNNEANARSQLSTDCYSWPGTDRPPCDTNLHTKMSISTYLSQKLGTNLAKSCRIQTGFGLYDDGGILAAIVPSAVLLVDIREFKFTVRVTASKLYEFCSIKEFLLLSHKTFHLEKNF